MFKIAIILFIIYIAFVYKPKRTIHAKKVTPQPHQRPEPEANYKEIDPYQVLGIRRNASTDEIKQIYRELSKKNHPDLVAHMSEDFQKLAEEKLKKINAAYDVLKKLRPDL